jgi:DNA-binding NarL/FixJ family response regulator
MRILVCDPDQVSRNWIHRILNDNPEYQAVADSAEVSSLFEACRKADADVVVLAAASGDGQAVSRLVEEAGIAVIVVTVATDGATIWSSINQGISGYLLKDRLSHELCLCLSATEAGGIFLSPPLARLLINYIADQVVVPADAKDSASEIYQRLLPRERETLQRLAAGQSTEQIAAEMSVALSTVRTYVSRVLRKVAVRTRGEAIALAYRTGYCSPVTSDCEFLPKPTDVGAL